MLARRRELERCKSEGCYCKECHWKLHRADDCERVGETATNFCDLQKLEKVNATPSPAVYISPKLIFAL